MKRTVLLQVGSTWLLRQLGWTIVGSRPDCPRYIIIVCPHTTNWDFPLGLLVRWALGIQVNYIGKHQLFRPPFGFIFRWLGGRPVHRDRPNNLVQEVANIFRAEERFVLALAPEGTRSKVQRLKTGFYYIALNAEIPILPVGFDFAKKTVFLDELRYPSGDLDADFERFLTFFRTITPKYPELGIGF